MFFKSTLIATAIILGKVAGQGYVLPSSGSASTTQFYLGPELGGGTACGVSGLPNGQSTSGRQGGGPGYLYVCPLSQEKAQLLMSHRQQSTSLLLGPTLRSLVVVDLELPAVSVIGLHQ
jgi:hypothetical protein